MFLSFVLEHGGKKAEMCDDQWKDQTLVLFLIYTPYHYFSKQGRMRRRCALSIPVLFGDGYLAILNKARFTLNIPYFPSL